MIPSWNDLEPQDLWTLTAGEIALLPGMTDQGRLGFAIQLKFMQLHGRFPERHDEIDPSGAQWLAAQLGTTADALSAYELNGRQGQRHQRTIRGFLGFRPTRYWFSLIMLQAIDFKLDRRDEMHLNSQYLPP